MMRSCRFITILPAAAALVLAGCAGGADPLSPATVTAGAVSELELIRSGEAPSELPVDIKSLLASATDADEALKGACCLGDSCVWTTSQVCLQVQGIFLGEGRPCDAESCLVADLALMDSDQDGCTDLNELYAHTNPQVPGDCADIDGDGIPNKDDPDVDGDGAPNQADADIDGDGQLNDDDADPDGDGEVAENDPDEDGDGLSDRFDLDDDGDGVADDEDADTRKDDNGSQQSEDPEEDDQDSGDRLLDLVERLRQGSLTAADRKAITREVIKRLKGNEAQTAAFRGILDRIIEQANLPTRNDPPSNPPSEIVAVDALYEQLRSAIDAVRDPGAGPREPLEDSPMATALTDFIDRASVLRDLGEAFQNTDHKTLSSQVTLLRNRFNTNALKQARTLLIDAFEKDPDHNNLAVEKSWVENVPWGVTVMAKTFEHETIGDLVDNTHVLFKYAYQKGQNSKARTQEFLDLVERCKQSDQPKFKDAVDEVIRADRGDDGAQEDAAAATGHDS